MSNPTIGLYLSPFPKYIQNEKDKNKYLFMFESFMIHELTLFKQSNKNYVIIPYNLNKKLINECLSMIDGLIICGNYPGPYVNDIEHQKHYSTINIIFKKIININKVRPFPVIGECYGYEMLINIIENQKKYNTQLFTNFDVKYPMFYKKTKFLNKKYKNNISYFYLHIGFLYNHFNNTKNLKNDYEIISILNLNKKDMIDVFKHKLYPIFFSKSHLLYDNKNIKNEFFHYSNLSYQYRKLIYKNTKNKFPLPKLKYKTIPNPHPKYHIYEKKIRLFQI